MRQLVGAARGLVAVAVVLGCVAGAHAAGPRGLFLQRRGRTVRIPAQPANVDSSPLIEELTRALHALGATDREYDGHRRKAVTHVAAAIHDLETPGTKGKSKAAIEQAESGRPAVATSTAPTPAAASDESLHKARTVLFAIHHKLTDHQSTRGRIVADSQVRIAIDEITAALTPATTPASITKPAAPAASPATGKPAG